MNQFFYTRTVEGAEFKDSFNVNKVIRSVTHTDGTLIVILDDFNERVTQEPDIDLKTNKLKGYKSLRQTVQSEIILSKEDAVRFYQLLNIEI